MNHDIEIYGDGEQVSDMIYVTDVAKALVNAMEISIEGKLVPAVEIGPTINNTVNEVAEKIIELSGSKSKIIHLPMRPGEIPGSTVIADTSTLEAINMDPQYFVTLEDGMSKTIQYFKKYLEKS